MWIASVAARTYGWILTVAAALQVLQDSNLRSWLGLTAGVVLIAGGRSIRNQHLSRQHERWDAIGERAARRRQGHR